MRSAAEVELQAPPEFPPALLDRWRQHREVAWEFLGADRLDIAAKKFFASLGVQLVHVTAADRVPAALARLEADAAKYGGAVALDTETAALPEHARPRPGIRINKNGTPAARQSSDDDGTALDPHRAQIVLLQCHAGGDAVYVFQGAALAAVLASPNLRAMHLVVHNAVFDTAFLQQWSSRHPPATTYDGPRGRIECSLQATGLTKGLGFGGSGRSLEKACEHFLGVVPEKSLQDSDWSAPKLSFGQLCYAATDAVLTYRLWAVLRPQLHKTDCWGAYELQRRATNSVVSMQLRGLLLDRDEHARQVAAWTHELSEARAAYTAEVGAPPPETPRQLQVWLEEILPPSELANWPRTDKAGELSTKEDHLKRLIGLGASRSVLKILAHRKLLSTFGLKLLDHINPKTGRLHPSFGIAATKAGRFSCARPNLQQLPSRRAPEFRKCIRAAPGFVLLGADWNQVELRAAAWISQDDALTELYRCGADLHLENAAAIAGIAPEDVTPEQRQAAKAVSFGSLYGIGPKKLVQNAFADYGVELTINEAANALDAFFRRFSKLARWRDRNAQTCQQQGFIRIGAGRLVRAEWEPYGLSFPQCCNLPIQGICADAMLRAMALVHTRLVAAKVRGGMIACIHDEILLEVHLDDAFDAAVILEEGMIEAFETTFPGAPTTGVVAVKIGETWSEAK